MTNEEVIQEGLFYLNGGLTTFGASQSKYLEQNLKNETNMTSLGKAMQKKTHDFKD